MKQVSTDEARVTDIRRREDAGRSLIETRRLAETAFNLSRPDRENPSVKEYVFETDSFYAKGGPVRLLIAKCDDGTVETACRGLRQYVGEQTRGEVQVASGTALLRDDTST